MKRRLMVCLGAAAALALALPCTVYAQKHELVHAKDGSGVFGYKDTPIQPWSGYHVHDPDRPAPKKVDPPEQTPRAGAAPADAVALFHGKDLSLWLPSQWQVEDGCLIATDGPLRTREEFGDCQLHLEWQAPAEPTENVMNRGNNGIYFLGAIEVQIFDSYRTKIYPDGQAGAIYAQTPPLVNACRPPGQWETFDIVFLAPKFDQAGKLLQPARITMFHNGLLVASQPGGVRQHGTPDAAKLPGDPEQGSAGPGRARLPGPFSQHLDPAAGSRCWQSRMTCGGSNFAARV